MSTKPLNVEGETKSSANIGEEIRKELEKRGLRAPSTDKLMEEIKRMKSEITSTETVVSQEALHEQELDDAGNAEPIYTADGKGQLVSFQGQSHLPEEIGTQNLEGDEQKLVAIEQELGVQIDDYETDSTGNLLADASHELRSPLQAITGFLELLQNGKVSNAQEAKHFLNIAYSESQYLTNRVADLEVASLIEAGLFRVKSDPVLVNQLIKSCVQSHVMQAGNKQILLKEEHLEDLPTFFGDELRIRQALSNIIEWIVGSVDHNCEVIIGAGVEDNSLWISVESRQLPSNGETEPTQQAHPNSRTEKTSKGLAIFIAKHIIETHSGKLVMSETLENDLCCRILLPLSMEKTSKGTILITEDNPHTGLLLEFALEQEGFTPIRATNGSDALNILDETKVDLIILDAILPGMDGFELCQRVRSSPGTATIPIVMASAKAKEENHAKALGLGANAYFQKPLSLSKLIPVVEKLIEEYKEVYQAET